MTAISDHCGVIREWLNFEYSDAIITAWTRKAEEYLNEKLRCKHMVQIDTGNVTKSRVYLPSDWLELDFVRVVDGIPLTFIPRHEFYELSSAKNSKHYTISGNFLIVGGDVEDGRDVEITYYQTIPPLDVSANWLMRYYSGLYIDSTLAAGAAYSKDYEAARTWMASAQELVDTINKNALSAKSSGSRVTRTRAKGFG